MGNSATPVSTAISTYRILCMMRTLEQLLLLWASRGTSQNKCTVQSLPLCDIFIYSHNQKAKNTIEYTRWTGPILETIKFTCVSYMLYRTVCDRDWMKAYYLINLHDRFTNQEFLSMFGNPDDHEASNALFSFVLNAWIIRQAQNDSQFCFISI